MVRRRYTQGVKALTPEIISILSLFSSVFTRPTWKKIQTLFIGAILCRGARRVSSILRVMGLGGERSFSKYHRVFNQAQWSGLALSKILLGLLIRCLPKSWPILVAVDETLERRRGKKIKAKGMYRDAVRSSQSNVVTCMGLKWEVMTLIVPLPWSKRPWALPFLSVLAPSKQANEKAGKRHKTSIDWTCQMVKFVARWLNRASWILVGDGAYACTDLAHTCINTGVTLISRLRQDAQLFEFPEFKPKKLGRPPIKGKRISLKALLDDPEQTWQSSKIDWYAGKSKIVEYSTFVCLWYQAAKTPVPMRIVLVKTPDGKQVAETFFSTDTALTATQIIFYFVCRWNIETTFEETRAHLGIETQRQWSDKAIQRCTPLLLGLYSIVTLIALKMNETKQLVEQEITTWYDKQGELTFSDILVTVRRSIWKQRYFSNSANNPELSKIEEQYENTLLYQLALAA